MAADQKVLDRVGALIKLANGSDEEEARTAAMQATKLMKEHELVLVPKSEIDRVQKLIDGAQALAKQTTNEGTQKMFIGGVVGLLLAKQLKF